MSEGNVTDISTGLKAIDLVPEANAVGEEVISEAPKLKNVPISRDNLLFTHWIRQFMPTGYEVVVNLPYLPDSRSAMFLIKCSPEIMPIIPVAYECWVLQKNFYQFVRHDVHAAADPTNPAIANCPPGIFINQVTDPPPLCALTAHHRFWKGKLNFHIRVVGNFNQAGYVRTTKIRNVAIPPGIYDRYKHAPIPQKLGSALQSGYFNSYMRGDVTMFRHQELTVPFEQITPVDMLDRRKALNDFFTAFIGQWDTINNVWRTDDPELTHVIVPNNEDYIAVEAVGDLAASQQDSQLRFIIEIAAGDDFELMTPLPLSSYFFDPQSKYFDQTGNVLQNSVHNTDIKIPDIIPDPTLSSNGWRSVSKVRPQHT